MESSGEGGRLQRKLSLPARFGKRMSLRKSPKPPAKTSKPPAPDPPHFSLKPSAFPKKPPALPPKPSSLATKPSSLYPNLPELTSKPAELTLKPLKLASEPLELIPKPNTRMFNSNEHAAAILQGCEHFRSDKTLCDVTLESGDGSETFPVHRVIMAAASEYFRAMFTGGVKEQQQCFVKLPGVSGQGLRRIIDFIYRGGVSLDMDCLRDTLEAARHLQVVPVLSFCNQLLNSEVTVENCVEVERVSRELCLEEVQAQLREFIRQNFLALVQSGRYLQLSEHCMSHALESHTLKGFTEAELYRVTRDWLDMDGGARREHTHALMSRVRFPLMPPAVLLRISQEDQALRSDPACAQLLLEASTYQTLPFLQPALQSARTRIRSDSAHILVLGGIRQQQLVVGRELLFHDDEAGRWQALRPMEEARYQHGAALLGGFLFVVGGQSEYDTKGRTADDSAYRYDPRTDRWLPLPPLNDKRTFFHLSALRGQLYAVGGRNASGEIDTVECYDLSENEWRFVCPMAEPLYGHAGTTHEELMYISGGITRDTFRKELCCYDPMTDTWSRRADMATPRGLHCMCAVAGRLYVMGGNHFLSEGSYADVLSVEFYRPATGQWTAAAPMPLGQSDVGVAMFRGQVYVMGGYSWSNRCMVNLVQRYKPESDAWRRVFSLPKPMAGIRAFVMTVHTPAESHAHECLLDTPTS